MPKSFMISVSASSDCARIGVGMFSARESLFLVVADDPETAFGGHLDERCSSVVESADTDASEIGCFAARQSCDQLLRPLGGEWLFDR